MESNDNHNLQNGNNIENNNFTGRKRRRFITIKSLIRKNRKKINLRRTKQSEDFSDFSSQKMNSYEKNKKEDKNELIDFNLNGINNEIIIYLRIKEKDINQNIYFLNNPNYNNKYKKLHLKQNNGLKKLSKMNTSMFINNKKYNFQKYYNFNEKGEFIIKLKLKIFLENSSCMFLGCNNIDSLDLSLFKTKSVKNMSSMFMGCTNLIKINLSSFDTKRVKKMDNMFYDCINLLNINLSHLNTTNVISLKKMFYNCINLVYINLSTIDTTNVTDMSFMFYNCFNLANLDLSGFNTYNVKNMEYMFANCKVLLNLNLSSFNLQNVQKKEKMFFGCDNLENIIVNSILYGQIGPEFKQFNYTIYEPE